jgi:NADPH-dependent curcumin reductase CurA
MSSGGIGEVVQSRDERFKPGDLVSGDIGWQAYAVLDARQVGRVGPHRPLSQCISLLGVAGKTAYHGLINVPGIHAGETLLVSAAAGSVGSMVGQIGRIKGAKVIGIAGGTEKCAWVVNELGFDACLDYKDTSIALREQLARAAPNGVDVYFDNTGGDILQVALFAMRMKGRVSCCGAVSMYDGKPRPGPFGVPGLLVTKRLRMEGFIVSDYAHLDADAEHDLSMWARSGQLKVVEDIVEGLENAPAGLIGLLAGENRGDCHGPGMSDLDRPPATLPTSARASAADRACFARVARANTLLEDARPPASFRETLARMEALRAMLPEGAANAGERAGEDDLESHLA